MSLAVAIQMDPIDSIDIDGDSTFALALEAQQRGHGLYYYLPRDLSMTHGRVVARAHSLKVERLKGAHFELGAQELIDLATFDVVLLRQDPPFDMGYITTTHLLEQVHPETLVVNDPHHVRNAPEKLFVTHFPELMPPTLISSNKDEIEAFRDEYRDIIMKPLYGNGGAGVFRLRAGDENFNSLFEMFTQFYVEPIVVQQYLPDVRAGDKRIILVDGEAVGAINRVPPEGESRSNMHVGGRAEQIGLTERDKEICHAIGPALRERGLIFVGIDVIGDYLTEINVTSPTGIQEIDRFDGINLSGLVWEAIEARVARR
ncbi:MAG: glutathione synthase [Alphaproteobacteria bacterium]